MQPSSPVGRQHEVVYDELAAIAEEFLQRFRAGRRVENIIFRHLFPGQCAARLVQPVARAGQFLFLHQQIAAGRKPLLIRNDGMRHDLSSLDPSFTTAPLRFHGGRRLWLH